MRSSTKPLGMSKTEENNQKDDFQRIQKSWCIYLAFILQLYKCWGPHCHFGPFWAGIDVLDSSFDSSMSLNGFIRYPDLRLSNNLEKKYIKTAVSFENHLFGYFWPLWTFLTSPGKSSLSLIGSKRYPDVWEVQYNLSISHNLKKKWVKTVVSFENHPFGYFWPFWTFWRLLGSPHCLQLVL